MNQENNQNQTNQNLDSPQNKNRRNWWIEIISILALGYLIFSLISPIFFKEGQQPRKIELPDILVIAIILFFNSDLLNRLEDFGISKEGGITAKFRELKQEVNKQKKEIDELQAQQLEQLEKQQKNLEEMQAFMYNFLLGDKDYEKIAQLDQHLQANTNYNFYVSEKVADELRRLRDLKLIQTNSGYISDLVKASDYGRQPIDLTKYFCVTDLGKKFLTTRNTLHFSNQQEINNSQETPKVE
ncbi:hypothetical protein H6G80_09770 [Nostoc sp. FACHB-87]|uniref:hypothetical protein n=1 Tax=Nostocaceae TaxID=1162 RepID=UPI001685B9C0|nr:MULTISPECIES: hypothetical protein [Nostocaceae]MBD2454366.1 hypothetical protein [Nostoc sp. FACHB-87]MBD2474448.1 hypothetical protein [Anabaena sp. FACHB-83]